MPLTYCHESLTLCYNIHILLWLHPCCLWNVQTPIAINRHHRLRCNCYTENKKTNGLSIYLSIVVPSVAPAVVGVRRTTATTATLTWNQLSLVQSRGFLTAYKVTYKNTQRSNCPQVDPETSTTLSVDQDETQLVITDLDPRLEYCVGIAATTVVGMSDYSAAVKVPCKSATLQCNTSLPQKMYWSVVCGITIASFSTLQCFPTACSKCISLVSMLVVSGW